MTIHNKTNKYLNKRALKTIKLSLFLLLQYRPDKNVDVLTLSVVELLYT